MVQIIMKAIYTERNLYEKVVIFGADGHTGKYLTRKMQKTEGIELTAFVRDPSKQGRRAAVSPQCRSCGYCQVHG